METGALIKRGFWATAEDISVYEKERRVYDQLSQKSALETFKIHIKLGFHQVSAGVGQQIEVLEKHLRVARGSRAIVFPLKSVLFQKAIETIQSLRENRP